MQRLRIVSLAALMIAGLSCDSPTGPRTGGINIVLLTSSGAPYSVALGTDGAAGLGANLTAPSGGGPISNLLDGARLTVTGPTTRTITAATAVGGEFVLVADQLDPGTYSVTVEGLIGGAVASFGTASGIAVAAGRNTDAPVTFASFQPVIPNAAVVDTNDILKYTVSYGAVAGATGYIVEWSTSPSMAGAQSVSVTGTSTDITVAQEAKYYVTVKAVNSVVTAGGLPSPVKGVYLFQGVASVTVTPATPTIAAGATQQLAASALDATGAAVTGVNWFWSSSNHAVATVSQSGLVTAVDGGQVAITAVGKGTPGSAAVTVTALPATKVAFIQQPGNTTAGQTISAVKVAVQNANGQTVTTDNTTQVSLAIGTDAGPGGALAGLQTVSVVAGIATFSNLSIAVAGSGYTLTAAATGLTGATSANFNILPGAATQLAFTVQPSTTAANAAMSPAVQVTVQDALGNRVSSANNAITVAIGTNPSGGTLAGTKVVNAVSGVASFSGLAIDIGGTGYTFTANASGLTQATSAAFDVGAVLPASKLVFSIQPASATAGDPLSPAIQVEVQNANNERIVTSRDAVTLAFANNAGAGALAGTKTVNAIDGIASFTGIWINKAAAGYTLSAASGALTGATSGAFTISPAAPAKLDFNPQPGNATGNVAMAGGVSVRILDAYDNVVTSAANAVTLGIGNNPYKGFFGLGGTITATNLTVSAVAGIASFSNVRIDKPASGYRLAASSAVTGIAISSAFNVNVSFGGSLSAGGAHTCAVSATSGTYCWGANYYGQLASLNGSTPQDSVAALVRGGLTFATVAAGDSHSCGVTAAGAAYCWGYNANGQLGNNSTTDSNLPVAVSGGHVFTSITAGNYHTCGITTANVAVPAEDAQVYCWGYGLNGQLGNAATANSSVPVRVANPLQTTTRATSISAGAYHTCAVAATGAAYCWGSGANGQIGDGFALSPSSPTLVAGGFTWTTISAGYYHTCGITTAAGSNVARCWGFNGYGQLGDGTTVSTPNVVTVQGAFTTWSTISAGGYFTCGTLANGLSFCWGYNYDGELGDNNNTNTSVSPSLVAGNLTFLAIEAGGFHACGRTSTALYCWGYNGSGRLGSLGVDQVRRSPTQIIQ